MPNPEERRRLPRTSRNIPVMFAHAMENPYCYYGATTADFSRSGMGFHSDYCVTAGSLILVRFMEKGAGTIGKDTSDIGVLEVVWCASAPDTHARAYGFGGRLLPRDRKESVVKPVHLLDQNLGEAKWCDIFDRLDAASGEGVSAMRSLERAKEAAETRARHLSILNRFAAIITSTLEFDDILQTISREMVTIFRSRNAGIGLLDREGTALRIVAFHTEDPAESDATGIVIPLSDYDATRFVIETRQSIIVPDAQHNPLTAAYHRLAVERGTLCLMIVPLMTAENVIGTIGLPATRAKPQFTPDEVLLAQTIAAQISGAIENARLYKKTVVAKNLAEKELEIGRQIQNGFLPEELPSYLGWEFDAHFSPARQVSGDFYDVVPMGQSDKVGLVMGDVCDKGVGAALFMALFRSLIRAFLTQSIRHGLYPNEYPPIQDDRLLLRTAVSVNDYIATVHGSSDMYATIFMGLLNLETGRLLYVNGGHEPPLICGPGGVRVALHPTGPAVGLYPGLDISVAEARLNLGETLVAFTDGVIEAENPEGRFFTRKRLLSLLAADFGSAAEVIDAVLQAVRAHIRDQDQYDDLTLLAVRRLARR